MKRWPIWWPQWGHDMTDANGFHGDRWTRVVIPRVEPPTPGRLSAFINIIAEIIGWTKRRS